VISMYDYPRRPQENQQQGNCHEGQAKGTDPAIKVVLLGDIPQELRRHIGAVGVHKRSELHEFACIGISDFGHPE
jgi:hypothetical protein